MAEIYTDANAVIDYARERALLELGLQSTNSKAAILRKHLGEFLGKNCVSVPAAACNEARNNLRKDILNTVDKDHADIVWLRARSVINDRLRGSVCLNNPALIDAVHEMSEAMRSNPKSRKFAEWHSRKSRHVARPTLGSGNDPIILSTAAQNARRRRVELWTRDADFIVFADEIDAMFNVEVVDAYRLDERFAG